MAERLTSDDIVRWLELADAARIYPANIRGIAYHELAEHALDHYPAALRELAELRAENETLRSEASRWRATASQAQQELLMIRSRGE